MISRPCDEHVLLLATCEAHCTGGGEAGGGGGEAKELAMGVPPL